MKRKFIFLIAGIILTLSGCVHVNAENKMVVEGRTWWYQSFITKVINNQYAGIPCNIGLTLKNDSTDGWMGCYAIDATDNLTIPVPLARLKESDGTVMIRPNLNLLEYSDKIDSDVRSVFGFYLGYWCGNYTIRGYYHPDDSGYHAQWNMDPVRTEFLLYDFNATDGFCYEWPWAGTMHNNKYTEEHFSEKGFFVENIETDLRGVKRYEIGEKIIKEVYASGKGTVLENIGLIESNFASFFGGDKPVTGFFIAPASLTGARMATERGAHDPVLMCVREADGTCIYGDESFQASVSEFTNNSVTASEKTYDLYGREVKTVLPGSVYIRNGKKFIGR